MHSKILRRTIHWVIALFAALLLTSVASAQTIEAAALVQPEAFAKELQSAGPKPAILFVGPKFLYTQAHVAGAEFIGPASNPQSMEDLRKRVAATPKNARIVLYCGCCPWDHCPNIRPAYSELHKLGFTNVKVLYMPTSLGKDWVEKGYPVEKGEANAR
jgi:thiosulfate/3-mercaptopyruvate sulfurtransferase